MPKCTQIGLRRAARIITKPNPTRTQTVIVRPARCKERAGGLAPDRSTIFSTTNWSLPLAACKPDLLSQVEPFPTKELKPYNPGFLSGWVVERYQIDLIAAAQSAREQMERLCAASAPRKFPATRIATCRFPRIFPVKPSNNLRSNLATHLRFSRATVSGSDQWIHRRDRRPLPKELVENRSGRARRANRIFHPLGFEQSQVAGSLVADLYG